MRILFRAFVATVLLAGLPAAASAGSDAPKPPANDDCLACHGDKDAKRADGTPIFVDQAAFDASKHGPMACVDCHQDLANLTEFPHPDKLAKVDCGSCHDTAQAKYTEGVHGVARQGGKTLAARCTDCHGMHDIKGSDDPASPTHHLNLPATCGKCHGNADIIRRGEHPDRRRRGEVPRQHPREGAREGGADGGALVRRLPRQPRHPPPRRSGEPRLPDQRAVDVRQVPRGHQAALRREHSRHGARRGQREGAGLRRLPHGPFDPAGRDRRLAPEHHERMRHLPRRIAADLSRHVSRAGDLARVRARGGVRRLSRLARHPEAERSALARLARPTWSRRAVSATPARTRTSSATTRTPTSTIGRAIRSCTTPPSSWTSC